jgi:DNA mismatch repair protein MutL
MSSGAGASIAVLSEQVKNQIAAGEVIERPASVVKELVENALDAGARHIAVDLEEGGVKLVRVGDDGGGLSPIDLELAFASHATSKLRSPEDLQHIATLGFRGEALASIGSVARCRLFSRPRGGLHGAQIENLGGRLGAVQQAGGPEGTTVEVRDLFFNTPARRRFLKTTSTELARCLDVLQRLALANEGTGFVATHDGRRLFDVEPQMDLRSRVRRTYGAELAESLVPVEGSDGTTRLSGFVAPPRFSRTDTARQVWFLNGRPLRDKLLIRCLRDAFRGFLVEGRQPVAFLSLSMDPAQVDVNVHPAKAEVRFREERRVFGFLHATLRAAASRTDMATPGESLLALAARRGGWAPAPDNQSSFAAFSAASTSQARPFVLPRAPEVRETPSEAPIAGSCEGPAGPFLQIARTYLVREVEDGFEILDQHALHERLTFEGLKRDLREGSLEVQRLLVPELVEVSRAQAALAGEHAQALEQVGLPLSLLGPTTIALQGVPARIRNVDAQGLVRDVLEVIEMRGKPPTSEDVLEEVLHRAACRASVMAGDVLSAGEIQALLAHASEADSDQTCPHARPTRVRFTLADLEKAFHRR